MPVRRWQSAAPVTPATAPLRRWQPGQPGAAAPLAGLRQLVGRHGTRARAGVGASEQVTVRLDRLGPQWRVLHAVPVGSRGTEIDHLVVGPGGVFTVHVERQVQGRVRVRGDHVSVDGRYRPYVPQARAQARRAAALLSAAGGRLVTVTGLVVPADVGDLEVDSEPADVGVVGARRVHSWLKARSPVLGPTHTADVWTLARRTGTWQPAGRQVPAGR